MRHVSFCFSGWVSNAEIEKAMTPDGKEVDISKMDQQEFVDKLNKGELVISFADAYDNATSLYNDIFEYE